jgi:hypothetical protein
MHLRLAMDFQAAGQEDSFQRQMFIKDLKQDLAYAAGAPASGVWVGRWVGVGVGGWAGVRVGLK